MASTVSQCTRDMIYIRDSRYVVPCVCVSVRVSSTSGIK